MKLPNENYAPYILIGGLVVAFIAPLLLTRAALLSPFQFHDTGQIGDTIGGIAGPILNFIGLLLVYLSFKQQLAANQIQIGISEDLRNDVAKQQERVDKERNFELLLKLLNQLKQAASEKIDYSKIKENLEDHFENYMGNYGQDIGEALGRYRYQNAEKLKETYNEGTEEYNKALEEANTQSDILAIDGVNNGHISRFKRVLVSPIEGRKLYYILHTADQIIIRLDTLPLFEHEKTFLKDEVLFTIQNLRNQDYFVLRTFLFQTISNYNERSYYNGVVAKTDFFQKMQIIDSYGY